MTKNLKHNIFITGIGTDVGKTLVAAIITETLNADYWKPVQTGFNRDSETICNLITNKKSVIHNSAYEFKEPLSPHAAAKIEQRSIKIDKIIRPKTHNNLVIEGAGGVFVPLNKTNVIMDLILPEDFIIIVSRHYLGSINHTLLTINSLKMFGFKNLLIVFNGNKNEETEQAIDNFTGTPILGKINQEEVISKNTVTYYASRLKNNIMNLINGTFKFSEERC